jgi:hypothetical protein
MLTVAGKFFTTVIHDESESPAADVLVPQRGRVGSNWIMAATLPFQTGD